MSNARNLADLSVSVTNDGSVTANDLTYTGALTGSTGVLNIGSGQIYKDTSGNIGIGTSSPSYKLEVVAGDINVSADSHYRIGSGTDRYIKYRTGNSDILYSFSSGNFYRQDITNSTHSWFTGNTERLRLDSSGNLGLGVTPSAWGSAGNLQFGSGSVISASTNNLGFAANAYYSNGFKYISNDYATLYKQVSGQHQWSIAPSGTAENAISFTRGMTLDASGNLNVGDSSSAAFGKLTVHINGNTGVNNGAGSATRINDFSNATLIIHNQDGVGTGSKCGLFFAAAGSPGVASGIAGYKENGTWGTGLQFYVNNITGGANTDVIQERMRLDSSGQFLLGTTSVVDGNGAQFVNAYNFPRTGAEFRASGTSTHYAITFRNGNGLIGNISTSGSTTAYNTSSDQRLKEHIVDAPSALSSVNAIKVRSFDWKSDGSHVDYGYIAQELLEVVPEAVSVPTDHEEMMGVDFGKLTPRLVKAIQELTARLEALENK